MKNLLVALAVSLLGLSVVSTRVAAESPDTSVSNLSAQVGADALGTGWSISGWWNRHGKEVQEVARCVGAGTVLGYVAVTMIGGPVVLIGATVNAILCL